MTGSRQGFVFWIFAVLLFSATKELSASDWPRFRGPNGSGLSLDKGVPAEVGEDKNLLWKIAIPGSGNSSPIVSGGRIYLQTATPDGSKRLLLCLDLHDGKILWDEPAPGGTGTIHQKNTLASCTGAADGERVFMPFWDGKDLSLAAFSVEGKSLWNVPLGPYASQHGAGVSPIVVGDLVILANDQDGSAEILALNAADGTIVWRKPRPPFKACYSTPLLLDQAGEGPEVVVASTAGVSGYEPATGAEKWKWNWTSNNLHLRTVGSPIISDGMVFFSGGNGPGDRHAVAVKLDGRKGEMNGDHLAWETRKILPYVPCMLAHDGHIYFVNDAGIAGCVEAKTGKTVWNQRLGIGLVTASPLIVEDRVYAFSETGGISVFTASPKNKEFSTSQLSEGVLASPAVADGRLLVRGRQHLYCFGTK